ncbi:MAG TPA: hypothetical protein VET89_08050 [Stellaceae bacterium]|nr:hypothetical protein [Stellaceae bacterium]
MPIVLLLALAVGPAASEDAAARRHLIRCWHVEHGYYELHRRIAETGIVWRRQEIGAAVGRGS